MIRLGVMGCSSFAIRAMLPVFRELCEIEFVCIASRSLEKASKTARLFGCEAVEGYDQLLARADIDAVYMPLPTGLHHEWATKALMAGKHLLIEKSLAESVESAQKIMTLAKAENLLVMENFQFQTHRQWVWIKALISSGQLGDIHLIRSTFGFPPLPRDNFRWNAALGGGALLDAGAYMAKVSQQLMGRDLEVIGASSALDPDTGVDRYGEAMFRNKSGQVSQVAYGFDYHYQCRLELLGTKGKFTTDRILTAPPGLSTTMVLENRKGIREVKLEPDNHYKNMASWFAAEIERGSYEQHWNDGLDQARLIDQMRSISETREQS